MHRYLLHNGEVHDTRERLLSPGQVGFMNGWGVFSTIRVFDGVLFAFERHYQRMRHDAAMMHVPFDISESDYSDALQRLIAANNAQNATLRTAVIRNHGGLFEAPGPMRAFDCIAFIADLTDWAEGVKLAYKPNGRHAASPFAGAKITSWAQNLTFYEEAHEHGLDEYLLLNEHGQVSECTSANVFIIRGDEVLTPPLATSGCLPGVTRAILLEEIHVDGFTISERDIMPSEVEDSDQVFITSTTRDLLPVAELEGHALRQDRERFRRLRNAFTDYRAAYRHKLPNVLNADKAHAKEFLAV